MLSCKDVTEHANKYLDKDLPFVTRLKVKMHLSLCAHCRRYINQLQTTIHILGKMKKPDTTDEATVENVVNMLKKNVDRDADQ